MKKNTPTFGIWVHWRDTHGKDHDELEAIWDRLSAVDADGLQRLMEHAKLYGEYEEIDRNAGDDL